MAEKGWNQSELARRASAFMPKSRGARGLGRDVVSSYTRARHLPRPAELQALCKALDCQPEDLLPTRGVPSADSGRISPFSVRDMGNNMTWLQINQAFPQDVAYRIISIIAEAQRDR